MEYLRNLFVEGSVGCRRGDTADWRQMPVRQLELGDVVCSQGPVGPQRLDAVEKRGDRLAVGHRVRPHARKNKKWYAVVEDYSRKFLLELEDGPCSDVGASKYGTLSGAKRVKDDEIYTALRFVDVQARQR